MIWNRLVRAEVVASADAIQHALIFSHTSKEEKIWAEALIRSSALTESYLL